MLTGTEEKYGLINSCCLFKNVYSNMQMMTEKNN